MTTWTEMEAEIEPKLRKAAQDMDQMDAEEAAKEAVQGIGFDLLIVCGFAFDPHVSEEVKRYGKLTVLPTKMNPDLAMGDELLKKTGADPPLRREICHRMAAAPSLREGRMAPLVRASRN